LEYISQMKLFTIEYNDFHIGIATWAEPSDNLLAFANEIHCMFLGNKPLYLFLNRSVCVLTHADITNAETELRIASEFESMQMPTTVPDIYNLFIFDVNDESFGIEARIGRQTCPKTRVDMERSLGQFDMQRMFCGFDIIKTNL
jgi:hypothetical protein